MDGRLRIFPITTRIESSAAQEWMSVAGCDLRSLAQEFGTPLYLYDQATMDNAESEYRRSLDQFYPGKSGITYASKAYLCTALARWVMGRSLWLDCTGIRELRIARNAGVPRECILVHGVNKSDTDLETAFKCAGTIVIDHLSEVERIIELAHTSGDQVPGLWLRLRPGVTVDTHAYNQTGQPESKFGMDIVEAVRAVHLCLMAGLPLTGLHFHLGSALHDLSPIVSAINEVLDFTAAIQKQTGWSPVYFSPGGGCGVAYHEEDLPYPSIEAYVRSLAEALTSACHSRSLPLPHLQVEPGRSLVARAGVAVYRVGAVKHASGRRWLLLDGGLADNPRPALYGARYTALPVTNPRRPASGQAWLGGPFCESGDVLIQGLELPDMIPGELLAIPVSGAYQLSMSSNYNGACRPAVLWLLKGHAWLIQRRETPEDLIDRDLMFEM